jgi:hypothetical protein
MLPEFSTSLTLFVDTGSRFGAGNIGRRVVINPMSGNTSLSKLETRRISELQKRCTFLSSVAETCHNGTGIEISIQKY